MNYWKVYKEPPADLDDTTRVLYVIEYADRVKIGRTRHPRSRIRTHLTNAQKNGSIIGRIAVKAIDDDFYSAETNLHHRFDDRRIEKTEEFLVPFDEVIRESHPETVNAVALKIAFLEEENKRLANELRFAKKIAEALGFDWTLFYEEEQA